MIGMSRASLSSGVVLRFFLWRVFVSAVFLYIISNGLVWCFRRTAWLKKRICYKTTLVGANTLHRAMRLRARGAKTGRGIRVVSGWSYTAIWSFRAFSVRLVFDCEFANFLVLGAMSVLNFEISEFPTGWMVCLCGGISFQCVCFVNLRFWVEVSWLESIAIGCFYESFAIEVFGFPHTALCWTYLVNGFC